MFLTDKQIMGPIQQQTLQYYFLVEVEVGPLH